MSHVRRTAPLFDGLHHYIDAVAKTIEGQGHHDMERLAEAVDVVLGDLVAQGEMTSDGAETVRARMNADDFLGGINPEGVKLPGCSKWPE